MKIALHSYYIYDSTGTRIWMAFRKSGYNYIHREGGPAIEKPNGDWEWIGNNKTHRIGGPARKIDGREQWFLQGYPYSLVNYEKELRERGLLK